MPDIIKLKRSGVTGAQPSSLELGEVALNYADGKLFYRNLAGSIVELAGGGGEDTALRALFLPPAPTSLAATTGNAQVSLSWTAPSATYIPPITDYVVQYSSNSGSTWTTFSDGTSTSTSATVTGLTNGTAYVFRVAAVNGVGTGAYTAASSSVTPGGDPLFASVSMLLHFDGASPTDSSSNALSPFILRGSAALSTSQSRFGGKALFLSEVEGAADALSAPSSTVFEFGTGDWCVEGWYFPTQRKSDAVLWHQGTAFSASPALFSNASGKLAFWGSSTQVISLNDTGDGLAINQWSYVAVSCSSGTARLYVNGSLRGSGSYGASVSAGGFTIGLHPFGGWNNSFAGYVDEFRVTKGSDRGYTGATIGVPTAPFPDA